MHMCALRRPLSSPECSSVYSAEVLRATRCTQHVSCMLICALYRRSGRISVSQSGITHPSPSSKSSPAPLSSVLNGITHPHLVSRVVSRTPIWCRKTPYAFLYAYSQAPKKWYALAYLNKSNTQASRVRVGGVASITFLHMLDGLSGYGPPRRLPAPPFCPLRDTLPYAEDLLRAHFGARVPSCGVRLELSYYRRVYSNRRRRTPIYDHLRPFWRLCAITRYHSHPFLVIGSVFCVLFRSAEGVSAD